MFEFNKTFCNNIAQLSIKKFNDLPKTGKPNTEEWTILSCIGKYDDINNNFEIVALGTGTKCIGANKMSPTGDILNDSHAEIICRRAFLRYLYSEITNNLKNENNSIFNIQENKKFILRENITFHFFTTQVPCGDAAIFLKQNSEEFGKCITESKTVFKNINKRSLETNDDISDKKIKIEHNSDISDNSYVKKQKKEIEAKDTEIEQDLFRTGAKCLINDVKQDSKLNGLEYHTLGVVRTKPGRGDLTLSVSCSDKFAKWTFLGLQGALLSYFLVTPIYLTSFTIAGDVPFSEESFVRSVRNRFNLNLKLSNTYEHKIPYIGQANIKFSFSKNDSKKPCPSSIIWSKVSFKPLEISVDGKKQGVTKKNRNKREGRLLICKKELFIAFMNIVKIISVPHLTELQLLNYGQVKQKSEYYSFWDFVKTNLFNIWTVKDEKLLSFTKND